MKPKLQPHASPLSPCTESGGAAAKAELRARLRALRAGIAADRALAAAQKIAAAATPFLQSFSFAPEICPVALYAALPGELDCFPLLDQLAQRGFPTLLPVAGAKATPLAFRLWRPGDPLVSGRYGLREPLPDAAEMTPIILLAPLLGFDSRGGRLGFGGGYYDATLAALRPKGLLAGGLAFACQKVENLPLEAHDERLDFVVTEETIFQFSTEA